MKKTYFNIALALALPVFMGSCSEEDYSDANISGIPQIDDIADAVTINIDQNTNTVTFEVAEERLQGCYVAWIFGEGANDATATTTKSKVTKTYSKKGDYNVSVKLGNKNGLSDGVINKTFHINSNLVPSAVISALTGNPLYWNYVANGHFGCGSPNGSGDGYGLDWWSCAALGKQDSGMYDDVMTFKNASGVGTTECSGTYEYDPGEDGLIHCNSGVNFSPFGASPDGNDFDASASKVTSTWKVYYDDNDVLWLELGAKTPMGYVANEGMYNLPKFKILEYSDKKVVLISDNGDISWRYVFCPMAQNEVDDIGGDNYAKAIVGTWMMDSSAQGHLACGPSLEDALSWWSCGPKGKDGSGMYDDILTFTEDGAYTFDPGEDGSIYCNKGCSYDPAQKNDDDDYTAAATVQTTTYEVINEGGNYYLVLPAQTLMSYMADDAMYNTPKFLISRISKDATTMELRTVQSGISWNYIFKKVE